MVNFENKIIKDIEFFIDDSKKVISLSLVIIPACILLSFIPFKWVPPTFSCIGCFFIFFLIIGIINCQINRRLLQDLKRVKIYNTHIIKKKKVNGEDGFEYLIKVQLENKQKNVSIPENTFNKLKVNDTVVISKYDLWYKYEDIQKYTGNTFSRIDIK